METKKILFIFGFIVMMMITLGIPRTFSQDGIQIAYGDHFEMTCRNDGFVDFYQVILATANITQNVTFEATYSLDGNLVGDMSYEYSPEIVDHEVISNSLNGISVIDVSYNATLKPLKFTNLKLNYIVDGLLKKDENNAWHFKHSFNSDSKGSLEVLLKIPKPSQFEKLILKDTIPAPHVFVEESHYYVLVWKSPLFTFNNVSSTYIDVSYEIVWNPEAFNLWLILQIAVFFIGLVLGFFIDVIKKHFFPSKNEEKVSATSKRGKSGNDKSFISIMKMSELDPEVRKILAERNLTLAGFSLTALAFIIGIYRENISQATTLILPLLSAMFLFFLGSQFAHEAEYFWQVFSSDIFQYVGVIALMVSFYLFTYDKIQCNIIMLFPIVLIIILVAYLVRGGIRIFKFYKRYRNK